VLKRLIVRSAMAIVRSAKGFARWEFAADCRKKGMNCCERMFPLDDVGVSS